MKAKVELSNALQGAVEELSFGVTDKKTLALKVAHLVAALQVFTEHNFSPREQTSLFDIAGRRIIEIEKGLK